MTSCDSAVLGLLITGTLEERENLSEEAAPVVINRAVRLGSPIWACHHLWCSSTWENESGPPHRALLFKREHSQEPHYLAKWLLAPYCLNFAPALCCVKWYLLYPHYRILRRRRAARYPIQDLGNFIFPGLSRGPSHSPDSDPVNWGYHIAENHLFCQNCLLLPQPRRLITKPRIIKSARQYESHLHLKALICVNVTITGAALSLVQPPSDGRWKYFQRLVSYFKPSECQFLEPPLPALHPWR